LSRSKREPFRKGGEKTTLTRKDVATPTMCSPPLAIAAYEICRRARLRLLPLHIHINVAIVTRSRFCNVKPKFHMNCWPIISFNDRSCWQRCITGPANIFTCTYSFIFTIYKSLANSRGIHTRTIIFMHSET